jgi:hypothetical protein
MKRSNRDPAQIRSGVEGKDESNQNNERRILRLQDQNRMLTDEVYRKSQVITELEEEKRALIRQLFQQSSANTGGATSGTDTIKSSIILKPSQFRAPLRAVNGIEHKKSHPQNLYLKN